MLWSWNLESEGSWANNTWFSDNLHLGHLVVVLMKVILIMVMVTKMVMTINVWVAGPLDEGGPHHGDGDDNHQGLGDGDEEESSHFLL